jgi:SAM-dependent methyltransferase
MTVAPGSILTWLAVRDALLSRGASGGTFLDAGCGEGWNTQQLMSLGMQGVAIEPSPAAYSRALNRFYPRFQSQVELLNLALTELELEGKFDLGCAFTVIEHVTDDVSFLKELTMRVRRGGGLSSQFLPAKIDGRPRTIWSDT